MKKLPEIGYARLPDIIGNRKAVPPIPALIPVSKSTWWAGIKTGRFSAPVKLSSHTTVWRWSDIAARICTIEEKNK
jgi:predicted DNA-binding transcriptional regulator AlpA